MQYCCILAGCDLRGVYADLNRSGWLYFCTVYQEFNIIGKNIFNKSPDAEKTIKRDGKMNKSEG